MRLVDALGLDCGRNGATLLLCCADDPAAVGGELPASGSCVRTADISFGSGLVRAEVESCPIPCNPTWDAGSIAAVCGASRVCCQTQELQPKDCILDGDAWRPVAGADIPAHSDWTPDSHETHQDPSGTGCTTFAGGQDASAFEDCVRQLSVADQRGYCMALQPNEFCPHTDASYIDACTQINMGLIPPPQ
jgi:hypothetical protein